MSTITRTRAVLFAAPQEVRLVDDAPLPEMEEGDVLIRCRYVGLCGSNVGPYLGDGRWAEIDWPPPAGWLGHENVGQIVASRADGWAPGTWVLTQPKDNNGFCEYVVARACDLARVPDDAPDKGAYVVAQPLATVLRALARTPPPVNQRCAVVGQGPIGLIFTHLLRRLGAAQVIGVDLVPWRLEWARRMGATDVVDASKEDVIDAVRELTAGGLVDFCVEAGSTPEALITAAYLPRHRGRLVVFGVPHSDLQPFPWHDTTNNETEIVISRGPECTTFFQTAVDMIARGDTGLADLVTPRLPWERAPEAFEMYAHPAEHEGSLKIVLLL